MKHKGTKNLAILLALALLFALMPGMNGTAYAANNLTIYIMDMLENMDDNEWGYQLYDGDVSIAEGTYVQINMGTWHTGVMNIYMNGEVVYTKPSGSLYKDDVYHFTAGPNCKILGGYQNMFDWDGNPNVYITQDASVAVTGVTLNPNTAQTIDVGGSVAFTATVEPAGASDKTVKWSVSGTNAGAVKLYSDEACNTEVGTNATATLTVYAKGESAGSATVTVTTNDGAKTATCAVTVSNPTIAINPGVNNGTYDDDSRGFIVIYDGKPHYVTVNVTTPDSGATVKYGTASDMCTLDDSPTITNVGSLTVYYTVTAVGYDTLYGNATVEISKADQTHPAAPTAESVTVSSVTLVAIENGEYKCGDGEWQQSPTFTGLTKHSEYTFYQRLAGDANHNPSLTSPAAVIRTSSHAHNWSYVASGATVTATCANTDGGHDGSTTATVTINATGSTYTGSAYAGASLDATAWTAAGLAAPTIEYAGRGSTSYTKSTTAPTDAGDYTASVTAEGQTASMDFTIGKADPGTPTVTMSDYTYGGAVSTPSIGTYSGGGTVTYYYNTSNSTTGGTEWTGITATSLNANTYYMYAVIAPTNNFNGYTTATADFTISKATVSVTAEAKSKTYGETTDPALTYTSSGLVGSDTLTGTLERASGENAGTYAITQGSLTAGDNYTISYTGANFTINKAAITITADDKSSRYGDELAALRYTVGGAYKTGDELNVTLNTAASPTANVGEYEITVAYNNANYDATLVKGKYTITKTGLTVTAAGYTGSYDGNPHGITVDVGSSGATVYYAATELTAENYATAGSTTNPTYTDAGENTVYFYVVSGNYDPDTVSGSKTVIITRATGTANDAQKPTAKTDLVADNTDQALVTAPSSLPEGYTKVQYSLDGETWTDEIPTGKDAGSYTVNYKYVGDKNHNDFQGEPFTVTIRTLTVTFEVNGGSAVAAQNVIKGEKATKPDDPSKSGNAFDGWYQDATFAKAFDFETPITADVTLYAKWTPNDYTLTTITGTTSDANHVWYKDSNATVVLTAKLATEPDNSFAHYVRTEIDGTPVAATAREGSTVVTLAPADLQRLSVGAHTVSIVFDNGRVDTRLTVRQPSKTPSTGDQSHTALYLAALTVSVLGLAALTGESKKRRTAKH